jgi:hypothetical protein
MENEVGIRAVVEVTNKATAPLTDLQKQFDDLGKRLDALGVKAPQAGTSISGALSGVSASAVDAGSALDAALDGIDKWSLLAGAIGVATGALAFLAADAFIVYESINKLDKEVRRFGDAAGFTTEQLIDMATNMEKVSRFSAESAQQAYGLALRYGFVGDEFERFAKILPDVAEMLGMELPDAAAFAGRVIMAPEASMRQLRTAGIFFSEEQREVIKLLQETGREAEAASLIFDELARVSEGRAAEGLQTFEGALKRVYHQITELIEQPGFAKWAIETTNSISDIIVVMRDKEKLTSNELKQVIARDTDTLGRLLDMGLSTQNMLVRAAIERINEYSQALDALEARQKTSAASMAGAATGAAGASTAPAAPTAPSAWDKYIAELKAADAAKEAARAAEKATREQERAQREAARAAAAAQREMAAAAREAARAAEELQRSIDSTMTPFERTQAALVETVKNLATFRAASRITADEYKTRMAAIFDAFRTPEEVAAASYEEGVALLDIATGLGAVTPEQYAARMQKLIDDALPLVTVSSRRVSGVTGDRSLLGMSDEQTQALAEQRGQMERTKAAFDGLATSIGDSLGNAISQGGFEGMTTLQDIVRNTLRGILADILSSGIKNALKSLFSAIGSSGGGGGGLASFFTSLLLPKASGGSVTNARPLLVGEEGPEVFMPHSSGRILSNPTITGMGGGGVNYSPQTSIVVNGNALDEKTKQELLAYIELGRARDQRQLSRIVTQNNLRGAR